MLLDACRNNPLAQNLARAMGLSDHRAIDIREGLAEQKVVAGTLISYATQPGHVAYDGDGANGFFTQAPLEDIAKPGLEIRVLMSQARSRIFTRTQNKPQGPQVPWDHSSLMGAFYFNPHLAGPSQDDSDLRVAEEHARRDKELGRLTIAGLSPEQIVKAEELANWDFIKDR